jgi:multicomponent Na+:H+ antiporter subunit F
MTYSSEILLNWSILASFFMVILSLILVLIRFLRGPNVPDRIIAFDLMAIILMGIIIIYSIWVTETVFLEVAIIMALIAFLGTVAYARYLEKGICE